MTALNCVSAVNRVTIAKDVLQKFIGKRPMTASD